MKKFFSLVLTIVIFVSLMNPAAANNSTFQLTDAEEAMVLSVIQDYFTLRSDALDGIATDCPNVDESLIEDSLLRANKLYGLWESENRYIISIECSYEIQQISVNPLTENIEATVSEYTWINYNVVGYSAPATALTGFGTTHNIVIIGNFTDGYIVRSNSYDERDVNGHATADIMSNSEAQQVSTPDYTQITGEEPMVADLLMNNSGMLDLDACIEYSDKWAKGMNKKVYGFYDENDCANFVSQCIAAGGFEYDPLNINERSSTSSVQWWHDESGEATTTSCPPAWRRVSYFQQYWGRRYAIVPIADDLSNVYPGNPIISHAGDHIVLCVGYDVNGDPMINGHTNARYHSSVSNTSYYGTTILFLTGYCENGSHTAGNYVYNATGHWRKCRNCGSGATALVSHTYTVVGEEYVCTVCGYTRDIGLIAPVILNDAGGM